MSVYRGSGPLEEHGVSAEYRQQALTTLGERRTLVQSLLNEIQDAKEEESQGNAHYLSHVICQYLVLKARPLNAMKTLGIILVLLGLLGLAIETVTLTTSEEVLDIGPVQVERQSERTIPIKPIGAAVAIIGGAGIWFAASRRSQD